MFDRADPAALARATAAAPRLFDLARDLGGSISGEHGVGRLKADAARDLDPAVLAAQRAVKAALDPHGIMNPGAKVV
jgi:FAD/FMN-containing dehydrogenase